MESVEMVRALLNHANLHAVSDDPDTATACRWAAERIEQLEAARLKAEAALREALLWLENWNGEEPPTKVERIIRAALTREQK
jgi:hypothetical protein